MNEYTQNLAACEMVLTGGGNMVVGKTRLSLTAPGAGNNGSVNITANLDGGMGAGINTCNSASASLADVSSVNCINASTSCAVARMKKHRFFK